MLIAIDIDGTIARRNMRHFARLCNERLCLGIDQKRLEVLNYKEFLMQPEIAAYRERIGIIEAHHELTWLDLDPASILARIPLPGAVDVVNRLASIGDITYYTARQTKVPRWLGRNESMAEATRLWLAQYHFPNPDLVVFCVSVKEKLQRLAELALPAVLIDDHPGLVEEYTTLTETLRSQLTIVHFRATMYSPIASVHSLQRWEHIDTLIEKGVFHDHDNSGHHRMTRAISYQSLAKYVI